MPTFLLILKKLLPYLKYIIFALAVAILLFLWISKSRQFTKLDQEMQLYKRQLSGQLTDKEKQLQAANEALGISQSKFMEQKDLIKAFQEENLKVNADFEKFKKQYNIELDSYHRTVASLKEQLKTKGTTTVVVNQPTEPGSKEKISYNWKSGDGRFELTDPDIFSPTVEKTFTLNQNFKIIGEVYREKAGFLKIQKLTIDEVIIDGKNTDGSVKYKTIGTAKIIESHFNYTERAPDSWIPKKGVFGLWGVVTANFGFNNGLNPRFLLGTGLEFLQWRGLGIGLQLYLDVNQWQDSGFGVHLSYRPTIKATQLNIGVNLGLATQFKAPFQSYIPMIGLEFFLW